MCIRDSPYPDKLIAALSGMLAVRSSFGSSPSFRDREARARGSDPIGYLEDAADGDARDAGVEAHALSEAVVALATLARAKPWRWRLVDVRSTSLAAPIAASTEPADDGASAGSAEAPEAASALVARLARLLGMAERPEVAFNALYCVNCLMGEPPQSWGRGLSLIHI